LPTTIGCGTKKAMSRPLRWLTESQGHWVTGSLLLAAAVSAAPLPAALRLLDQRLADLQQQVSGLNARIADEQRHRAAALAQAGRLTRALIGLGRWPTGLVTLTSLAQPHPVLPQLLLHLRGQTIAALARQQKQLAALTDLQTQAAARQNELADLRRQAAMRDHPLSRAEKTALAQAAVSAGQLAATLAAAADHPADSAPPPAANLPSPVAGGRFPVAGLPRATATGLLFSAAPGAAVRAVNGGKVLYSGPFRQFGGLVIIATGPREQAVYAGLGTLTVTQGQTIETGHQIGALPAQPPVKLYWEVRHRGQPLPPSRLLAGTL
jgi:septal ring factor EnvC (AmiA/AmiB activator)